MIAVLNQYLILILLGLFLILMATGISVAVSLMHRLTSVEDALNDLLSVLKKGV